MKVCLIHPPHPNATDDRLDPPLGLLHIAAHLEINNIPVEVIDLAGMDTWEIPYADIYGLTVYAPSVKIAKMVIGDCRKVNPMAKVVVGGAHPSARPIDFPFADYVVRGPGELEMVRIANGPSGYEDPFVFPAYHLIDPLSYHRKIAGKHPLPMLTSRGCPYKCTFCGLSFMHKLGGFIQAEPELIANHIGRVQHDFGIDRIIFHDDVFTVNRDRLFPMLDLIKPLGIKFRCMGRVGYDTEETYKRLAEAGCVQVAWGIESGSQEILDRMNKGVTVQDNYNVIQWAKEYGISSRTFFIIGFPGETGESLEKTRQFIERSDPDQILASNFIPYPGTPVGDNPGFYGITRMSKDFDQFYQLGKDGTGGMTIDTAWLSKEEMRSLELEFRVWLKLRTPRGELQDYEKRSHDHLLHQQPGKPSVRGKYQEASAGTD